MKKPFPFAAVGAAAFIIFLLVGAIMMEINVWVECRSANSFWYCMRALSK